MKSHLQFKIFTFIAITVSGIFFSLNSYCQNQYLQRWAIQTDTANNYVSANLLHLNVLAQSLVAISTMSDSIDVYKIDSSGVVLWRKKYNVAPLENRITASKIASDLDFNYYLSIAGQSGSTRLVKLDSAGSIILNIPDTINDYLFNLPGWNAPRTVLFDYDANYLYVSKRFDAGPSVVYFITKYDHQFNPVWTRKLSTAYYNIPYHISLDANGTINALIDTLNAGGDTLRGFRLSLDANGDTVYYHNLWNHKFMITHWSSTVDGTGRAILALRYDTATWTNTPPSIIIARFDTNGTMMWSDTINSTLTQGEDPAGIYGDTWGNAYLLSYQTYDGSSASVQRRIHLRKYNPFGQQIWFKSWEGNDSTYSFFSTPYLKYFDENNIFVSGNIVNTGSYFDALLAKTDSAGNALWQSHFSANNNLSETFSYVERDLCNNIYVLGMEDSLTSIGKFFNFVKYINEIPCHSNVDVLQSNKYAISLYPNPSSGEFTLQLDQPIANNLIQIFDLTGRIVYKTTCDYKNILNISINLLPGMYILKVEEKGMLRMVVINR